MFLSYYEDSILKKMSDTGCRFDLHLMDKKFVISYLKARNYWWQTREISHADEDILRHEYHEKIRVIEKLERIVSLSGIRRSGKTT